MFLMHRTVHNNLVGEVKLTAKATSTEFLFSVLTNPIFSVQNIYVYHVVGHLVSRVMASWSYKLPFI